MIQTESTGIYLELLFSVGLNEMANGDRVFFSFPLADVSTLESTMIHYELTSP